MPFEFSERHRRALVILLVFVLVYVAILLLRNPTVVDNPQPPTASRAAELADKIDPNTADVPTLAALPGLGMKRAAEIVRYREDFQRANPGQRAFRRQQDLLKIKGFGYAMMMQLSPHMIFDAGPTTAETRND